MEILDSDRMTPRERFTAALTKQPMRGRIPTFELVFYLTMEAFGKVHPEHRVYRQWDQMTETERELTRTDIARIYVETAEKYEHDAIYITGTPPGEQERIRMVQRIREISGDRFFLTLPGDATYSIPHGDSMMDFSVWIMTETEKAKDKAQQMTDGMLARAESYKREGGLDGFCMCADYCFNTAPFFPPDIFAEVVTPYLKQLCTAYREMGFYSVKHTDGNIMPILDQIVDAGPDALHSIDPQAGVDIAEVKRLAGDKLCLCGNVNCGMLTTGTDEEVIESARYAIRHGSPGGGYVFCTSNCVFTGMRLERYDLMLDVWRREGRYPEPAGR